MAATLRRLNWLQFFPFGPTHTEKVSEEANRLVSEFGEVTAVFEALRLRFGDDTNRGRFYGYVADRIETDNWLVGLEF